MIQRLAVLAALLISSFPALAQGSDPESAPAQTTQTETEQPQDQTPPEAQAPEHEFRARVAEGVDPSAWSVLEDPEGTIAVSFAHLGAGIEQIMVLDETERVNNDNHVVVQERTENSAGQSAVPFGVVGVEIEGRFVSLGGSKAAPLWRETAPGSFEAIIEDQDGTPVLRVVREFTLREGRHGFVLDQRIENLSDVALSVKLYSTTALDMPRDENGYAGDRRRFRYGTMASPERQGDSLTVKVDHELDARTSVLGSRIKDARGAKYYEQSGGFWPEAKQAEQGVRLSWYGFEDRYHAVVIHPVFDPATSTSASDRLLFDEPTAPGGAVGRLILNPYENGRDTIMVLTQEDQATTIAPGAAETITYGVYAGPRTRPIFLEDPMLAALNMPEIVVYNLGGICAACTFDWLTHLLIGVLRMFHSIVQDWAISIMLLVVVVRGCLHPVTRWSQIRMQRFGVQMQSMGPKQKALREKYKDDPKRMQQEMTKLWREEGISPTGMLGCLPMFLQSPVWIALYATLFYAYDLRQQPGFYGIFQTISNDSWRFLADLSRADSAIPLPSSMHFSFPLWGTVDSINLLPILMGIVFFMHQKFMTPPTQESMTPEQESQQKMMKVMMVVMFPVMMYTAPSGLALYFITNSTLGIVESKWIRAHMKKHGMLEIENIRAEKAKKGPGFLQRLTEAAEASKQIKERGPAPMNPADRRMNRRK